MPSTLVMIGHYRKADDHVAKSVEAACARLYLPTVREAENGELPMLANDQYLLKIMFLDRTRDEELVWANEVHAFLRGERHLLLICCAKQDEDFLISFLQERTWMGEGRVVAVRGMPEPDITSSLCDAINLLVPEALPNPDDPTLRTLVSPSSRDAASIELAAQHAEPPQTEPPQTEPPQTEPPQTEPSQTEPPQTDREKGAETKRLVLAVLAWVGGLGALATMFGVGWQMGYNSGQSSREAELNRSLNASQREVSKAHDGAQNARQEARAAEEQIEAERKLQRLYHLAVSLSDRGQVPNSTVLTNRAELLEEAKALLRELSDRRLIGIQPGEKNGEIIVIPREPYDGMRFGIPDE